MIKKYKQFLLLEADENKAEISQEIKDELKSMIEKTIKKSGGEFNSFIDKLIGTDSFNFYCI